MSNDIRSRFAATLAETEAAEREAEEQHARLKALAAREVPKVCTAFADRLEKLFGGVDGVEFKREDQQVRLRSGTEVYATVTVPFVTISRGDVFIRFPVDGDERFAAGSATICPTTNGTLPSLYKQDVDFHIIKKSENSDEFVAQLFTRRNGLVQWLAVTDDLLGDLVSTAIIGRSLGRFV